MAGLPTLVTQGGLWASSTATVTGGESSYELSECSPVAPPPVCPAAGEHPSGAMAALSIQPRPCKTRINHSARDNWDPLGTGSRRILRVSKRSVSRSRHFTVRTWFYSALTLAFALPLKSLSLLNARVTCTRYISALSPVCGHKWDLLCSTQQQPR